MSAGAGPKVGKLSFPELSFASYRSAQKQSLEKFSIFKRNLNLSLILQEEDFG